MTVKLLAVLSGLVVIGGAWTQQDFGLRIAGARSGELGARRFRLPAPGSRLPAFQSAIGNRQSAGPQSEIRNPKLASVWDGVYTEEQAKRGQALYNQLCASCHLTTLTGGEMATPLVGAEFAANWDGLTVGELFERIRLTMPPERPEQVSRQQKADILAYMLSVNKFPAGKTELARESHLLSQIRLEMTKR